MTATGKIGCLGTAVTPNFMKTRNGAAKRENIALLGKVTIIVIITSSQYYRTKALLHSSVYYSFIPAALLSWSCVFVFRSWLARKVIAANSLRNTQSLAFCRWCLRSSSPTSPLPSARNSSFSGLETPDQTWAYIIPPWPLGRVVNGAADEAVLIKTIKLMKRNTWHVPVGDVVLRVWSSGNGSREWDSRVCWCADAFHLVTYTAYLERMRIFSVTMNITRGTLVA